MGISDPSKYAIYIFIPFGIIFCLIATFICYIRLKKIRHEYLWAILPVCLTGFAIKAYQSMGFMKNIMNKYQYMDLTFVEDPIVVIYSIILIIFFAMGIGIMSASKMMPSHQTILVHEIGKITNIKYYKMQWLFDFIFSIGCLILMLIAISLNKYDGNKAVNYSDITHYLGVITLLSLVGQGYIIYHSRKLTEKIFKFLKNHKTLNFV